MAVASAKPPVIRGFEYQELLGSGGFADVFLYQQELPRREVAVKVLHTEGLTAATRASFVAEANVMAQLSAHPYIVSILHADLADDGRPYLVMEYCSGPNLADRYKAEPFPVAEALRTGIRIAGAVATAHAAGILHRDIKPANVLTNSYGWPALTDFGIASAVESDVVVHTTTTRAQLGEQGSSTGSQSVGMSIPWSPPEMFDDDPRPDVRSDVFSLAATVWTLLAGRTPFEVAGRPNQSLDLMSRIERGAITPMERGDVPGSLVGVLRKGMSVDPSGRYATAVDFAQALQRVELELGYTATPIDVPNLTISAPVRERGGDSAPDATRARGMSTLVAQAPAPAAPVDATKARPVRQIAQPAAPSREPQPVLATVAGSAPVEKTVVRRPAVVESSTGEASAPASRRRRGALVGILLAVAAVLAVIVVVAVVPHGTGRPTSAATGRPDDSALDVGGDVVPTPVLVSSVRSADGSSVTFTWSDPKPVSGDSYLWQRTDGAGGDAQPTTSATATVPGVTSGTTVCISISVVRSGELSPNPLKACNP